MSGDIFWLLQLGAVCAAGISWVEASNAAKPPETHSTAPFYLKVSSLRDVTSAEAENLEHVKAVVLT